MSAPPSPDLTAARAVLKRHYGYDDFRPAQRPVVEAVLFGSDVLAVLPTGAGKSICFQIPALVRPGLTLIISPLIALMQDQVDAARARGIPAAYLNSALSTERRREVLSRVVRGEVRLLYVAPERLPRLADELLMSSAAPGLLAVDEAHCISEWGHDFRPAYRAIGRARRALGWPQTVALTGSATPDVREDIAESLRLGLPDEDGVRRRLSVQVGSFDRANLRFEVVHVGDRRERLAALLAQVRPERGTTIVYAGTRNLTESLARVLWEQGVRAIPYHAGLTREKRAESLERFLNDDVRVVVATCAFGMGIDKPGVRLVVHWTTPPTPESYYQEAGRAGRDGGAARCVLLFGRGDVANLRRLLQGTFPDEQVVERAWGDPRALARLPDGVRQSVERLRAELKPERGRVAWAGVRRRRRLAEARLKTCERYAAGGECRRRVLIGWFGEALRRCAGCDVCGTGVGSDRLERGARHASGTRG